MSVPRDVPDPRTLPSGPPVSLPAWSPGWPVRVELSTNRYPLAMRDDEGRLSALGPLVLTLNATPERITATVELDGRVLYRQGFDTPQPPAPPAKLSRWARWRARRAPRTPGVNAPPERIPVLDDRAQR